jgi:ElaB/YqjD/DUF883 family membrane-anchored ribosome-binding protein
MEDPYHEENEMVKNAKAQPQLSLIESKPAQTLIEEQNEVLKEQVKHLTGELQKTRSIVHQTLRELDATLARLGETPFDPLAKHR